MPDAVVTAVTKGVLAELAGAVFSQTITPERSYADWELALETERAEDGNRLLVDVVGHMTTQEVMPAARGDVGSPKLRYGVTVDIAVRKRFDQGQRDGDTGRVQLAEVDELVYLVQEIGEHFNLQRMNEFTAATHDKTEVVVNPDRLHLREFKQFTGIVRITFNAFKTPGA